jgi:hypothetical protein
MAAIEFIADEHRFENFSNDFAVWVFFCGDEGGEASAE